MIGRKRTISRQVYIVCQMISAKEKMKQAKRDRGVCWRVGVGADGSLRLEKALLPQVTAELKSEGGGSKPGGTWGRSSRRAPSAQTLKLERAALGLY